QITSIGDVINPLDLPSPKNPSSFTFPIERNSQAKPGGDSGKIADIHRSNRPVYSEIHNNKTTWVCTPHVCRPTHEISGHLDGGAAEVSLFEMIFDDGVADVPELKNDNWHGWPDGGRYVMELEFRNWQCQMNQEDVRNMITQEDPSNCSTMWFRVGLGVECNCVSQVKFRASSDFEVKSGAYVVSQVQQKNWSEGQTQNLKAQQVQNFNASQGQVLDSEQTQIMGFG
ncbi:hypothetical protein HAX54_015167, partial [Datura stramonium]|nr:hypothetical protein [Datura stramonium]